MLEMKKIPFLGYAFLDTFGVYLYGALRTNYNPDSQVAIYLSNFSARPITLSAYISFRSFGFELRIFFKVISNSISQIEIMRSILHKHRVVSPVVMGDSDAFIVKNKLRRLDCM